MEDREFKCSACTSKNVTVKYTDGRDAYPACTAYLSCKCERCGKIWCEEISGNDN